jgi:hypothetical protein
MSEVEKAGYDGDAAAEWQICQHPGFRRLIEDQHGAGYDADQSDFGGHHRFTAHSVERPES